MPQTPDLAAGRHDFDHSQAHARGELLAWGEKLRTEAPISYSSAHGGIWIASGYAAVTEIARDSETFISAPGITIPPLYLPAPAIPAQSDAPLHAHYRRVLLGFLMPKMVMRYEASVCRIVAEALDGIVEHHGGDAVADFAAKIPTRAMATVFGLHDADAFRFDQDFSAVIAAATRNDDTQQKQAVENFRVFLLEKLDERRPDPSGDDVVSAILRYEADGRRFTEDECLGLLWSTAAGAVDTTKHAIGHMVYYLGVDQAARKRLIEQPALIPDAVEEMLRLDSPIFGMARHVAKDVCLENVAMKAGDKVLLVYGWANRDNTAFAEAETPNLARKPNRHVAFGHGRHQCVGMHLARLELKLVLQELLARIPHYALDGAQDAPRVRGGLMWAYEKLMITC